jgi:hypothetical protein
VSLIAPMSPTSPRRPPMADLDRYDLDESYMGECPLCGGSMYDDGEHKKIAGELAHKACVEEAEEELNAMEMDWSQSE